MQEEVNEKVVGLCIKATHMSSDVLKAAMRKYLYEHRQSKQMRRMNRKEQSVPTGKQSLKDLLKQGAELSNIPVTEKNIKDSLIQCPLSSALQLLNGLLSAK